MVMKYPSLKWNLTKRNYYGRSVTIGDNFPSYSTVKNRVARFGTGHLSTRGEERSWRPTQVMPLDAIHSMILNDRKIIR